MSMHQFVQVPLAVLTDDHLSTGPKLFLAHLLRWDWGNGCWLTDKQLAQELNVSERTVRNHTKALEEAGHLWVFEDREGMTVRVVVRPNGRYPKPSWASRSLPASPPKARKNFSTPTRAYMGLDLDKDLKHMKTTGVEENRYPVRPEQEPEPAVVSPESQKTISEGTSELTRSESPSRESPKAILNPESVELLVNAGVVPSAAQKMAQEYPPVRVWDAVEYVQRRMARGEQIDNPGGYIRRAIENGWKEFYRPNPHKKEKSAEKRPTEKPVEPRSQESLSQESDRIAAFENARKASPWAGVWEKALEVMDNPVNLDAWIIPTEISELRRCYIADVSSGSITLAVPDALREQSARRHLEQILEGVRIAGLEVETIGVNRWQNRRIGDDKNPHPTGTESPISGPVQGVVGLLDERFDHEGAIRSDCEAAGGPDAR